MTCKLQLTSEYPANGSLTESQLVAPKLAIPAKADVHAAFLACIKTKIMVKPHG